jgi:hypothetical protein
MSKATRTNTINRNAKIVVVAKKNPRKVGTAGYKSFPLYRGRTVADYLTYEGSGMNHLRWDLEHKHIRLSK